MTILARVTRATPTHKVSTGQKLLLGGCPLFVGLALDRKVCLVIGIKGLLSVGIGACCPGLFCLALATALHLSALAGKPPLAFAAVAVVRLLLPLQPFAASGACFVHAAPFSVPLFRYLIYREPYTLKDLPKTHPQLSKINPND